MKCYTGLDILLALLVVFQTGLPARSQTMDPPEYRASWVFGFGSHFANPTATTTLINTLADNNFNVVVPEIRKQGDAYYNSAYEPWASDVQAGYDPLADIITKAHARGMEVYGWIVTYRIWPRTWAVPPSHIWAKHPEWAMTTNTGSIIDGSYYNLDPGVPGVQQYICDVMKDCLSKYDLDGYNFDYIRYPTYTWGYNPIAEERFKAEYGVYPPTSHITDPLDPNYELWQHWCEWRRQQVTDLVKKCYLEAVYLKPRIKISCDTIGWMGVGDPTTDFTQTRAYTDVFQDHHGWMLDHIIDLNILMNYKRDWTGLLAPTYVYKGYSFGNQQADHRLWSDYLENVQDLSGRHAIDGIGGYMNIIQGVLDQWGYSRANGVGLGVYRYGFDIGLEDPAAPGLPVLSGSAVVQGSETLFYSTIKSTMFQNPAPIPDMPWKTAPTTGIVFGTLTDASKPNDPIYQDWVYKATVQVTGPVTRSTTTDGTGTYGFMDLPPGTYDITVSKTGFPTRTYYGQTISEGDVLREDFDLGYTTCSSAAGAANTGWTLFSLPLEPVNPDPPVVLPGIGLDCNLYRWDNASHSQFMYYESAPGIFGNLNTNEGYWLYVASPYTISYQAYGGTAAQRRISLPSAGWAIVGCPFQRDVNWEDVMVTNGGTTVSMQTAAKTNNWLNSTGYWWDSSNQSLYDIALLEDWPYTTQMHPWHGYWFQSYVNDLTLTLR